MTQNITNSVSDNTQTEIKEKKKDYKKDYSLKSMIDLVKYPVFTEKTSIILANNRQYTFDVDKRLTKTQIKQLFESLFEVNVISVNTHIPPRRTVRVGIARGYRPSYKRAIITLKENQTINYNINFKN
jgi:large subunit ribosomal protein L23